MHINNLSKIIPAFFSSHIVRDYLIYGTHANFQKPTSTRISKMHTGLLTRAAPFLNVPLRTIAHRLIRCHNTRHRTAPSHIILCRFAPRCALYRILAHRDTILHHTVWYCAVPHRTSPYRIAWHHIAPCDTILYRAVPYRTVPH